MSGAEWADYKPRKFERLTINTGTATRRYWILECAGTLDGDYWLSLDTRISGGGYGNRVLLSDIVSGIVSVER